MKNSTNKYKNRNKNKNIYNMNNSSIGKVKADNMNKKYKNRDVNKSMNINK